MQRLQRTTVSLTGTRITSDKLYPMYKGLIRSIRGIDCGINDGSIIALSGSCRYASGHAYTGSWKAGRPSGRGTQTFQNGDTYEGEWRDGMMDGQVGYQKK